MLIFWHLNPFSGWNGIKIQVIIRVGYNYSRMESVGNKWVEISANCSKCYLQNLKPLRGDNWHKVQGVLKLLLAELWTCELYLMVKSGSMSLLTLRTKLTVISTTSGWIEEHCWLVYLTTWNVKVLENIIDNRQSFEKRHSIKKTWKELLLVLPVRNLCEHLQVGMPTISYCVGSMVCLPCCIPT